MSNVCLSSKYEDSRTGDNSAEVDPINLVNAILRLYSSLQLQPHNV